MSNIIKNTSVSVLDDPFLASVEATLKVGIDYIYYLMSGGEIVYVGITKNIMQRLSSHGASSKSFDSSRYTELPADCDPLIVEFFEIVRHQPKYNSSNVNQEVGFSSIEVCRKRLGKDFHMKTIRKAISLHYSGAIHEIHGVKLYQPHEVANCVSKYMLGTKS